MAVTRLKRKGRRNILKAKNKKKTIQRLKATPVIKNVDIEEIKTEFAKKGGKAAKKETKEAEGKEEKPKAKTKKSEE